MAVINITDAQFEEAIQKDKVLIKYYADWCGSCRLLAPKFKRLSEDSRFEGVDFLEINAEQNELARKKAGVTNLPFIALFSKGNLLAAAATSKEETIVEMLNQHATV